MGRYCFFSWDGAPLGMAVTFVDRVVSGNNPRGMSLQNVMLNVGEIISATIFRNRYNTRKGSILPYVSRSRSRPKRTGVRTAN